MQSALACHLADGVGNVQKRQGRGSADGAGPLVHGVRAQHDGIGPCGVQAACAVGQHGASIVPAAFMLGLGNGAEVHAVDEQLRRDAADSEDGAQAMLARPQRVALPAVLQQALVLRGLLVSGAPAAQVQARLQLLLAGRTGRCSGRSRLCKPVAHGHGVSAGAWARARRLPAAARRGAAHHHALKGDACGVRGGPARHAAAITHGWHLWAGEP